MSYWVMNYWQRIMICHQLTVRYWQEAPSYLDSDLVSMVRQIKDLDSDLVSMVRQIKDLDSDLVSMVRQIKDLDSDLVSMMRQIKDLDSDLVSMVRQIKDEPEVPLSSVLSHCQTDPDPCFDLTHLSWSCQLIWSRNNKERRPLVRTPDFVSRKFLFQLFFLTRLPSNDIM